MSATSHTTDIAMIRAKLRKSFDNIGKTNGYACPPTTSNIDPLMHEHFIATEAMAYWTQRSKAALDSLRDNVIGVEQLDEFEAVVVQRNQGDEWVMATGDVYMATVNMSKPASRLDAKALRNHMITVLGIATDAVDSAFKKCSKNSAPAKRFKVFAR